MSDTELKQLQLKVSKLESERAITKLEEEIRQLKQQIVHDIKPPLLLRMLRGTAGGLFSLGVFVLIGGLFGACSAAFLGHRSHDSFSGQDYLYTFVMVIVTASIFFPLNSNLEKRVKCAQEPYKKKIDEKTLQLKKHYAVMAEDENNR